MVKRDPALEYPDPTPVALPVGASRDQDALVDTIRRLIQQEMSLSAKEQGGETFDEANDFEILEDDFYSPYEIQPLQEDSFDDRGNESVPGGTADGGDRSTQGEREDGGSAAAPEVDRSNGSSPADRRGSSGRAPDGDGAGKPKPPGPAGV